MASVAASPLENTAPDFWDSIYTKTGYSRELSGGTREAVEDAVAFFGDVKGKTVIDVGCGAGATSLLLAALGAHVIAMDTSEVALQALRDRCRTLGIDTIQPRLCGALAIDEIGPCDFAFGSMILHHIEPFGEFCAALKRALKPAGKAFFYENNAASELLIWFRTHVVGKLWVPKYGDPYEFPLMPSEIALLGKYFKVRTDYPRMVFFQLASSYLLRGHFGAPFEALDNWLFKHRVGLKYSYNQYVYLQGE